MLKTVVHHITDYVQKNKTVKALCTPFVVVHCHSSFQQVPIKKEKEKYDKKVR